MWIWMQALRAEKGARDPSPELPGPSEQPPAGPQLTLIPNRRKWEKKLSLWSSLLGPLL